MKWNHLIRDNIRKLTPYSSARSEFSGRAEVYLDANENPYPLAYARYPDPLQKELKKLIGEWRKVDPGSLFLGNGSDEIIDLLIRVFCIPGKDSIYTTTPGFGMYKVAAAINDVRVTEFQLDENFNLDGEKFIAGIPENGKIIFLCSPNNPTGNSITLDQVRYICEHSDCIIVIDEAYIDFSDFPSATSLLSEFDHLVVMQTFSKAIGAAGLRIGMAIAHPGLIELLNKVKMPYNISKANQMEAIERMRIIKSETGYIEEIKRERQTLADKLIEFGFIRHIYPSDANFLLIKVEDANVLYQYLLSKGIIVRNRSSLKGCENCLRITIGTPEENKLLVEALQSYTSELQIYG